MVDHLAGVGALQAGEQTQQGGLAGAGFADDAQHFAGMQGEVDGLAALAGRVQAGQAARFEQRREVEVGQFHCRLSSRRERQ
ncbi:hypothetical protein FQZ97_1218970 [compost metagenome]